MPIDPPPAKKKVAIVSASRPKWAENLKNKKRRNMAAPTYHTVSQFAQKHPAFSVGALRQHIFDEHRNGLAESGAIVRVGRRVYINEAKFFVWLEAQNNPEAA